MINPTNLASVLSMIAPSVQAAPEMRIRLNAGMMIDIPTGFYHRNPNGRYILNGGLHVTLGIAGLPNTFKSTFMMTLTARVVDRLLQNGCPTQITTYDTETTLERDRLQALVNSLPTLASYDPFKSGIWVLTTKVEQDGTAWWALVRSALQAKIKNAKKLMVKTPYVLSTGEVMEVIIPTFNHLDSITTFRGKDVEDIDAKTDIGDSKGLMIYMKSGLGKARLLNMLSSLAEQANGYFMSSAHVGETAAEISPGNPYAQPDKKIPTMKANQRYKGVTDNFFSLMAGIWQTHKVKPLYVDKKPMYPKDSDDNRDLDTDLQVVTIQLMRSKSSGDGIILELIISKTEGFLPELSEFHYLKTNDKFGLVGNDFNYVCALYPEAKLSRQKIRGKLADPKLCRAINICSEMLQIYTHRKHKNPAMKMDPEVLYTRLKDKGYSWDKILTSRGWHSLGEPPAGVITVTTMDLLAIAIDELEIPELKENADAA